MKRRDGSYLNSGTVYRFIFALILFAIYFAGRAILRADVGLCDKYCEMTRAVTLILSGALSYVKFTAAEYLLYILIAVVIIYVLIMIFRMCTAGHVWARIMRVLSNAAVLYAALLVLFYALYGPAYSTSPIAEKLDIETTSVSDVYKLRRLTEYMRDRANEYAELVPRDLSGACKFGSFDTMSALTVRSFENAQLHYNIISGPFAPVKKTKSEGLLSRFGLTGIFVPYTGESIVNAQAPDQSMPFTMAHEMSHRLSIARENEANFMAFLVCRASTDRRANYSGYFTAYRYCISALSAADSSAAGEVMTGVSSYLSRDLAQYKDFSLSCSGFWSDVGEKVNNLYLKGQGQESGTASYGEMVDLLLAEYDGKL